MEKLSKQDEQRIMKALESVVRETNAGVHPNVAIEKAAVAESFGPPFIQRMVEAYNTSRTLAHFKHASGDQRCESFPIANSAEILARMYPDEVPTPAVLAKAACAPSHPSRETTNFMKASAAHTVLPRTPYQAHPEAVNEKMAKLLARRQSLQHKVASAKADYKGRYLDLFYLAKAASDYFRQIPHAPFTEVELNFCSDHGVLGKEALDLVHRMGGLKEKRASTVAPRARAYDTRQAPYTHLTQLLEKAAEVTRLAESVVDAEEVLLVIEKKAGIHKDAPSEPALALDGSLGGEVSARPFAKAALLDGLLQPSTLLSGAQSALGLSADSEGARRKAMSEATDPLHEGKLRAIQTQAMLNDLMANDPIISSYGHDEVTGAYNNLSKMAPHVMQQAPLMRNLLRRMLTQENALELHEGDQLAGLENKLAPALPQER